MMVFQSYYLGNPLPSSELYITYVYNIQEEEADA
jgi:hypothetical protein